MSKSFRIIYKGEPLPGFDRETVKNNFLRLCRIPADQAERYFTGQEITLRKGLSQEQVQQLLPSLKKRGIKVYIKEENEDSGFNPLNNYAANTPHPQNTSRIHNSNTNTQSADVHQYYNHHATSTPESTEDNYVEPPPIFSKSLQGRYGRLNFANAHAAITGAFLLLVTISTLLRYFITTRVSFFLLLFIFISWVVYSARAHALRLHDMNISEWFYTPIFLMPLVFQFGLHMPVISVLFQFVVLILMLSIPGTSGSNRFGLPSRRGTPFGIIIMTAIFIIAISLIFLGVWVGEDIIE